MTNLGISSRSHNGLYLGPTIECDSVEWLIWPQEWKEHEPILTQDMIQIKFRIRVSFDSRIGSKSKNWSSHSFLINEIWLSKISGSISNSMGTGINVGSRIESKLSKDTRVNIDSKIRTESQNWRSGSHLSSISLNEKLANLSKIWDWSSST